MQLLMAVCVLAPLTREFGIYHLLGGPLLRLGFVLGVPLLLWAAWRRSRSAVGAGYLIFGGLSVYYVATLTSALVDATLLPAYPVLQFAWLGGLILFLLLAQVSVLTALGATRRRQLEAEHEAKRMQILAGQETRLREEQTQFFSFVTQELRKPLAAIRTGLANLGRDLIARSNGDHAVDTRTSARLARMERSTERMAGMIERHLQLQRLTDPGFSLQRHAESPLLPVIGAMTQVAELYSDREISHHVAGELPATLPMDTELMVLALTNLLTNAAKYSPADSPIHIEIGADSAAYTGLSRHRQRSRHPPGEQDRLFRIYQRNPAAPARQSGFGIGLTLAARIAKLHGGSLGYRRVNELSVFILELELPPP